VHHELRHKAWFLHHLRCHGAHERAELDHVLQEGLQHFITHARHGSKVASKHPASNGYGSIQASRTAQHEV
jgi:capsule polysaccharide modification protein KpsS